MTIRKVKSKTENVQVKQAKATQDLFEMMGVSATDITFAARSEEDKADRKTFPNMFEGLQWVKSENLNRKQVYVEIPDWMERRGLIAIRANFVKPTGVTVEEFLATLPSACVIIRMDIRRFNIIWFFDELGNERIRELAEILPSCREDCFNARVIKKLRLPVPYSKNWKRRGFEQKLLKFDDESATMPKFVVENSLKIWVPPAPIEHDLGDRLPLPLNALPELLQNFIGDCSQAYNCPPDYAFAPLAAMIGALVGHKVHVKVDAASDLVIPANFWAISIGDSGAGKSPIHLRIREFLAILNEWAKDEHLKANKQYKAKKNLDAIRFSEKRKDIKERLLQLDKSPESTAKIKELQSLEDELAALISDLEKPALKRFSTNKSTLASLQKILGENPNGILMDLEELKGFINQLTGAKGSEYRSFLLECNSGFGQHDIDRLTTGTTYASNMLLSIFATTQPSVFYPHIRSALNGTQDNDGLWQRFNIFVHPKKSYESAAELGEVNTALLQEIQSLFIAISRCKFGFSTETKIKERTVCFTGQAKDIYQDWWDKIAHIKDSGDIHPVYENYLAKYKTLVPKLALLFAVVEHFDSAKTKIKPFRSISGDTVERAVEVAEYLESHARHVFDVRTNFDYDNAITIRERLDRLPAKFTVRSIAQLGWYGIGRDSEKVKRALEILEAALVIRKVKEHGKTPRWEVNPYVLSRD